MTQIFFDPENLKRGYSFELKSPIKTLANETFELEEWLGRGGNASVFRCVQSSTGDEFAIKFLMRPNKVSVTRFMREVRLLNGLVDDHIVQYIGTGWALVSGKNVHKLPFFIMELAENNLQATMKENDFKIEYEYYAGQFRGLARALAKLHGKAIHRDIKPENILVSGNRWILSDYGLCSFVEEDEQEFSESAVNMGPKYWLSPEGHSRRLGCGDVMNESSDVFQLAAIFWYVATGRHPSGILKRGDWTGPTKLFEFLEHCLLHNRENRPKNGQNFLSGLEDALIA